MIFKLSVRLFLREVKSGYLTSMLVSLILAITIVSGISLFTDRLEKALNSETEEFLGGKLKFESNNNDLFERINESYKDSQHTEMALFASVIVFAFTFGAFEIPLLLGANYPSALPVLAYRKYTDVDLGAMPDAMAIAITIAIFSSLIVFLYPQLNFLH